MNAAVSAALFCLSGMKACSMLYGDSGACASSSERRRAPSHRRSRCCCHYRHSCCCSSCCCCCLLLHGVWPFVFLFLILIREYIYIPCLHTAMDECKNQVHTSYSGTHREGGGGGVLLNEVFPWFSNSQCHPPTHPVSHKLLWMFHQGSEVSHKRPSLILIRGHKMVDLDGYR